MDSVAPADTFISTHTPLARRDQSVLPRRRISLNFYSHASCEARHTHEIKEEDLIDFYSHASCEARQSMSIKFEVNLNFYSHASCEARQMQPEQNANLQLFLLTRLLRGATHDQRKYNTYRYISTHTPLARRDYGGTDESFPILDFYSHASCEARLDDSGVYNVSSDFYSHASCEARHLSGFTTVGQTSFLLTRLLRGATG